MTSASPDTPALGPILQAAFKVNASDIHLKAGAIPMYRVEGELRPVEFPLVQSNEIEDLCCRLSTKTAQQLAELNQFEFSYEWPGVGRFRGHYYRQQGRPALALRPIPLEIPTMNELRLPAALKRIVDFNQGLVLVTGATGMGKSTTLACLLDALTKTHCRHIITIEDPIEFVIHDNMGYVTQREVGKDIDTFQEGLWAAMRQDPDVLLIGEARTRETMEIALQSALRGHLVFTSAHFQDTTAAVNGIIGLADPKEQLNWRLRLSEALKCVISQRLLPKQGTNGRVLATEIMFNEPSVRASIQDESRTKGLRTCLARGRSEYQTHTMDQCLLELLQARLISLETATNAATSRGDLMREINLRRIPT